MENERQDFYYEVQVEREPLYWRVAMNVGIIAVIVPWLVGLITIASEVYAWTVTK